MEVKDKSAIPELTFQYAVYTVNSVAVSPAYSYTIHEMMGLWTRQNYTTMLHYKQNRQVRWNKYCTTYSNFERYVWQKAELSLLDEQADRVP